MKLFSKVQSTSQSHTSDGVSVGPPETIWRVEVLTDAGDIEALGFDHDPTDDEIIATLPAPARRLAPTAATSKAALKEILDEQIGDARDWEWFASKVAADGSVPAGAKTAVANRADAEYAEAKRLANEWRQAT